MTEQGMVTGIAVAPTGEVTLIKVASDGDAVRLAARRALGDDFVHEITGQVFEFPTVFMVDNFAKTKRLPRNDYATCILLDAVFGFGNECAAGTMVIFGLDEDGKDFVDLHPDVIDHVRSVAGATSIHLT